MKDVKADIVAEWWQQSKDDNDDGGKRNKIEARTGNNKRLIRRIRSTIRRIKDEDIWSSLEIVSTLLLKTST